ncbi:ubiquitin carboxyl-terminal hydrolase 48-like isoform X1 [Temnothorax curvispinosus]|uniref:ubiquitinyl hydrolase 1 n=1 Tax=Temnothorax curvispinosus TaxID=300111 RepID=A0A6J1R7R6_9HYME|nr:ubiquitin carboxyl-terminal hydrolase 48-like isoform X1 [Temnothorax curvispinosus]XP_024891080.1 ubiquitin carboxyl-terminal hydrolase 48-like isoform X1 [Temnothorax curvispinosus]
MPPTKKGDLDKLAWAWVESVGPDEIEKTHLESAYRIGLKSCKNCKRNCTYNPQCLTGLGEEKFMKSQPAEVVTLESSLSELRDPTQYVGLKNLGATCYVNSLIQMWFHNEDMRRIIYKWDITEDPEEKEALYQSKKAGIPYHPVTAVGQLQYIFAMMHFGNRSLLDPINLAIALSLDTRTQQDAQEFSKLLLCHIEGKLQQNSELKPMLQKLTQGKYSYINRCSTCSTEYPTSTTFYELDLQLAATLKEAIDNYLSEEQLTGANQYHCVTCNDKKDARRFIRLESLPETLNIQLMRFVFHRDSGQKKKLNSYIQFPEDLDMSEYVGCQPQTHLYSLVAVLSHKGPSAHSGHYIANICNSSGEWYQFSDDKVEKMQNKRIEDGVNDKSMKRGRVPKGFLSSNTAYMLVYKKLTADWRTNGTKKVKLKKLDTEVNVPSDTVSSEKLIVKEKSDETSDETKQKPDIEDAPSIQEENPETIPKSDSENVIETDEDAISKKTDIPTTDKSETEKTVASTNGCKDTHDSTLEQLQNKVHCLKQPVVKVVKLDYKRLNGDAHRAMSCGERDFYEEMEFENWQVSSTMRELVRQENVKHELSLLAAQQEKQKEIEDQNSKRQLIIDVYNIIQSTVSWDNYYWIPTDWLSKWLNGHSSAVDVRPIDNSNLMCSHYRLDPLKVSRMKCVPEAAAQMLYDKYQGGPRLDQTFLCEVCVKRRCKLLRFKLALERDHKEVGELIRTFKESPETSYIIGTDSLRSWRRLAMETFQEDVEQKVDDCQDTLQEESKCTDKDGSDCPKEVEENKENEAIINFNEDLLCEHKSLKTADSSRKVIPQEAWTILKKYFPDSKEYPVGSPSCSICEERMENAQRAKKDDKIKAKQQKDELTDLYYGRNRNEISKCDDPEKSFYIVEKSFLDGWRSFIRYAEIYSRTPPASIQNASLLCEEHKGFLHTPRINNELYSIVTAEEWSKLMQFYEADYPIIIKKIADDYQTNPGPCAACMLAKIEQERLESLKYERATIYVKCIDENEESKTDNDYEVAVKRPKMGKARPSRSRRKLKGSHELKVSSEITLKELKVMTMQICGAGPYDQHIMLGEHELIDDNLSLAALGIFPGALLTLKIDAPLENETDVESDAHNFDSLSPEKGFKGTELVPS